MTTLTGFKKIKVRDINAAPDAFNSVMVIDDNDADRLIFSQLITTTGFAKKTLEAANGRVVIDWLTKFGNKPDETLPGFIFLDLYMPEMNGFEFLDAFEKLPAPVKVRCRIIVFTSSYDKADIQRVREYLSVYDIYFKPLKAEYFTKIREEFKLA